LNENKGKMTNLKEENVSKIKMDNICNQISNLQLKQISDCISSIKKDSKSKSYIVEFDKAEDMKTLNLDEHTYKKLLNQRDTLNSISVYDLFQEKMSSV